ncbi:MAG: class I SAM-dependent methyltransferase [Pseudomonadota bacterium]|nr:class I SAM-dependent methyltransferase [Pseudomonadota bacterium]
MTQPLLPSWPQILQAGSKLADAPEPQNVHIYADLVRASESSPPYHLRPILNYLEEVGIRTGKDRADIRVLDHGCGGAATLMYLAAMGFRQVYGVDVGGDIERTDRAVRSITRVSEPSVLLYDGTNLPFPDGSFDLIFSQQVLEHVNDSAIESYLDDEARVLGDLGILYHQIPHRWTPWESHTKTWAVHYLPLSLRSRVYAMLGHDPEYVARLLYLRSPFYYFRQLRMRYPFVSNKTLERLKLRPDAAYYEGNLKLRRLVSSCTEMPVIRSMLSNLIMLDVTAQKMPKIVPNGPADQDVPQGD